MKKYTVIFIITFCLTQAFGNGLLREAEKAYDLKKYKEAIKNYEVLVKDGYKSYKLYYNLGNAHYRNNEIGKAIYNYELARKLEPNDEDIRINLSKASAKTIDKIDAKENFFISAVKTNVLTSFTTGQWAWFSIINLVTAALLFFLFINSTKLAVKRISFFFSCVLLVSFFITYFIGYSAVKARNENKFAIIIASEVRVMNEPTVSAVSRFSLHEGTRIRIVKSNGDWVLIKLDNGNEGWVKLPDIGVI